MWRAGTHLLWGIRKQRRAAADVGLLLLAPAACVQSSSVYKDLTQSLALDLTVAYLQLGSALITTGRYTKALQHFKQGLHLFGGVSARPAIAACHCCLGNLLLKQVAAGGTEAQLDALAAQQAAATEAVQYFDRALEVRPTAAS